MRWINWDDDEYEYFRWKEEGGRMSREIKVLVEEAIERRIEKICEFHWRRVFGEEE